MAARAYSTAPVAEPPEDEMGTRWNEFLRCVDPKMTKNLGYTWVMNPVGGLSIILCLWGSTPLNNRPWFINPG